MSPFSISPSFPLALFDDAFIIKYCISVSPRPELANWAAPAFLTSAIDFTICLCNSFLAAVGLSGRDIRIWFLPLHRSSSRSSRLSCGPSASSWSSFRCLGVGTTVLASLASFSFCNQFSCSIFAIIKSTSNRSGLSVSTTDDIYDLPDCLVAVRDGCFV